MIYQCEKCKKVYDQKEIFENHYYKISPEGIVPICPNCKNKKFKVYDLVRRVK